MSSLFGSAGVLSVPPSSRALVVLRPMEARDIQTVSEVRRAEGAAGRWDRSRPERRPAEQTAHALSEAQQRSGPTDRDAYPRRGPAFLYTAQLLTQAARPADYHGVPHPKDSARASEAYRRAGAEPSAYPSEATMFRVSV